MPMEPSQSINIRPSVRRKFNRSLAADTIRSILLEELEGKGTYDSAHCGALSRTISRRIHDALRDFPCDRYKFAVHVVLGEKNGQGVKCAGGCLWDDDTDCVVSSSLSLDTVYCIASVFAVYCYHYK